jgi:A/G-specific adenine glycosylase
MSLAGAPASRKNAAPPARKSGARKTGAKNPQRAPAAGAPAAGAPAAGAPAAGAPAAADLLAWYDRHRRDLPWRAAAGQAPDPYRVWLSEIMLQQTTVKAVAPYFLRFIERWPNIETLAAAPLEEVLKAWAGLGYYARARNLHACARAVTEQHNGRFPASEAALAQLPGIGPYTAGAIAAIAFGARAAALDGNAERVMTRLYAIEHELPAARPQLRALTLELVPRRRAGDFAQALMDLGAGICTPKRPACAICPWTQACAARRRGDPEAFPRKARKRAGELRRGAAFVALRADGCVLLRTRPAKGLLGGMTEVPTTAWSNDFDAKGALREAPDLLPGKPDWRRMPGTVTHVFTHFPLELIVCRAEVPAAARAPAGARWVALSALAGEALPSLMRKVVAHAAGEGARPRPRAHR